MSSDRDAQNDEMLALESIFDSDEFSYRKDNEEFCGQLYAFVSLPGDIKIEYQFLPFFKMKNRPNIVEAGDLSHITVKYLPPIELSFTLPHDYPSTSPPRFTLICYWLGRKQLSELCEKLDSLWNENKGLEILYLWLSFLKEELFSFLKLGTTINLSKQYSFNMFQLERKKKLQSQSNVVTSSVSVAVSGSAGPSGATVPATRTIDKPADAGTRVSTKGRGRGRGRWKIPGFAQCPGGDNLETSAGSVSSTELTEKGCDQNSNGGNSERKSNNPLFGRKRKSAQPKRLQTMTLKQIFDPRVVSCEALQTSLVGHIMEYNKILSEKEFQRNIYSCRICFDDKPGSQCMEFLGCGHTFCRECMGSYFEVLIKDGKVHGLTCPETGCKSEALHSQINELVSPELFARYDELLLSSTLDGMEDIVYCPRKTCQYPVTYDKEDKLARCAHCSYTFCILCRMTYHGVDHCRLKIESGLIAEYAAATAEKKLFLEKKYGSKTIKDMIDTSQSELWIKGHSKSCPHCSAAIEKSDGCNKMICWKCNTFFCWICQSRLNPSNPYNHFNSPTSSCFQMLFHGLDDEEDDEEEEEDHESDLEDNNEEEDPDNLFFVLI